MEKIWYLQKINLLAELSEDEMRYIHDHTVMKSFHKNQLIYTVDDEESDIFFLKKGKVRLFKASASGKDVTYAILKEGEAFGGLAFIEGSGYTEYAEAMEETLTCIIPQDLFFEITKNKSAISLKINKLLGLRLYELEMMVEELIFKSVRERTISLLLRLHDKFGANTSAGKAIGVSLSHKEIATMIGATREATTTALNELKQQGIIDIKHRKIYIKDLNQLKKMHEL